MMVTRTVWHGVGLIVCVDSVVQSANKFAKTHHQAHFHVTVNRATVEAIFVKVLSVCMAYVQQYHNN